MTGKVKNVSIEEAQLASTAVVQTQFSSEQRNRLVQSTDKESSVESINEQLNELGVRTMSTYEVEKLNEEYSVVDESSNEGVELFSSSSNCKWWTTEVTDVLYDGKKWDVRLQYAQGLN